MHWWLTLSCVLRWQVGGVHWSAPKPLWHPTVINSRKSQCLRKRTSWPTDTKVKFQCMIPGVTRNHNLPYNSQSHKDLALTDLRTNPSTHRTPLLLLLLLLLFIIMYYYLMCMGILTASQSGYHIQAWCPKRSDGGTGSPATGLTGSCEPSFRCWESNLSLLEQQPLNLTSKPSLQPEDFF